MNNSKQTQAAMEERVQREVDSIDAAARNWVMQMSGEAPSEQQRAAFKDWIAADPRHEYAYNQAAKVWFGVEQLSHLRQQVQMEDLDKFHVSNNEPESATVSSEIDKGARVTPLRRFAGRRAAFAAGITAAAAVLLATVIVLFPTQPVQESHVTKVAEIRDIELADGTTITLGALSRIDVQYTESERRITLVAGEAYFDVAANANRPFLVEAYQTNVRVLGTGFNVRRGAAQVNIAVAQGAVEVVGQQPDRARGVKLTAGQAVSTDRNGRPGAVQSVSALTLGAWREGRLYYEDTRLAEVIADAKRYYPGNISLHTADLGELLITGSFHTDRIDQLLANLERILPIVIIDHGANRVIKKKPLGL